MRSGSSPVEGVQDGIGTNLRRPCRVARRGPEGGHAWESTHQSCAYFPHFGHEHSLYGLNDVHFLPFHTENTLFYAIFSRANFWSLFYYNLECLLWSPL